jgi:hypothetical protein
MIRAPFRAGRRAFGVFRCQVVPAGNREFEFTYSAAGCAEGNAGRMA